MAHPTVMGLFCGMGARKPAPCRHRSSLSANWASGPIERGFQGLVVSGTIRSLSGPLAQSVEQLTFNQLVAGSIPARPTKPQRDAESAGFHCPLEEWLEPMASAILSNRKLKKPFPGLLKKRKNAVSRFSLFQWFTAIENGDTSLSFTQAVKTPFINSLVSKVQNLTEQSSSSIIFRSLQRSMDCLTWNAT